ncbi:SWF or SNF family helicase [Streptomyces wuyuanensis]|uniref:SWIM zinc finger family protein n=1 Tax=Streptomyces wuyuanensis TaxID=1196353 RepID=UPI003D7091FF
MTHEAYGDEEERTFVALPPARGRGFAGTWWGLAWVKAVEDSALDTEQLKKGRKQARDGAVGAVSIRPGRITAVVRDQDGTGHRSDVLLQELSEDAWDRFLDMAVDRAGHIAALLDRDMPPHLVEDAAEAGVELLPGIGDLEPECTCDAWDLCTHTAALCYQVARLLDQDPFMLLLLRGRGERRLLEALQVRSAARAEPAGRESELAVDAGAEGVPVVGAAGVPAVEAFAAEPAKTAATEGIASSLLAAPPLPEEPGRPPSLETETEAPEGIDPDALEFLAADAAVRARRMLAEVLSPGRTEHAFGQSAAGPPEGLAAGLTVDQDAVRLAATARGALPPAVADRLAASCGRGRPGFRLAVRAWRFGGAAGLAVLDGEPVPDDVLARATSRLQSAADWYEEERPSLRAAGNARWTAGPGTQLRVGADGRWWVFTRTAGAPWSPAGPPAPDPASALAAFRTADVQGLSGGSVDGLGSGPSHPPADGGA